MDFPYFNGRSTSLSCIFLFIFLSGYLILTILQKHAPKPKHFYIHTIESTAKHSPTFSDIPVNYEISPADMLSDLDIEFTNITVTREEMIKG